MGKAYVFSCISYVKWFKPTTKKRLKKKLISRISQQQMITHKKKRKNKVSLKVISQKKINDFWKLFIYSALRCKKTSFENKQKKQKTKNRTQPTWFFFSFTRVATTFSCKTYQFVFCLKIFVVCYFILFFFGIMDAKKQKQKNKKSGTIDISTAIPTIVQKVWNSVRPSIKIFPHFKTKNKKKYKKKI